MNLGLAAGAGALLCVGFAAAALTGAPAAASPSTTAWADIPPGYLSTYQTAAAGCPGLDWTVLAGVGAVESDHGRSRARGVHTGANPAGAEGPMQFLPATFARYDAPVLADPEPTPPAGARPPSPYDPVDAIYAAARYLCTWRAVTDPYDALIAYNCGNTGPGCQVASAAYADLVLATAASYAQPSPDATTVGQLAAAWALSQLGDRYLWGGSTPAGFDCSGLVQWAYAHAGVLLPRTAQTQHDEGPALPAKADPPVGALVFFGTAPDRVEHVGIVVGAGLMVDAPHSGTVVRVDHFSVDGPGYQGATLPGTPG